MWLVSMVSSVQGRVALVLLSTLGHSSNCVAEKLGSTVSRVATIAHTTRSLSVPLDVLFGEHEIPLLLPCPPPPTLAYPHTFAVPGRDQEDVHVGEVRETGLDLARLDASVTSVVR